MISSKSTVKEGKGWFLAWIDRDPQTLARKKELKKMMRKKNTDEEKEQERIAKLIEEGKIKEARAIANQSLVQPTDNGDGPSNEDAGSSVFKVILLISASMYIDFLRSLRNVKSLNFKRTKRL